MKKRYVIAGLVALVVVAMFAGRALNARRAYVRELDEFRVRDVQYWIRTQRGAASGLDRAVAEVLVSPMEGLHRALENAIQAAHEAQDAFWRHNIPHTFYNALDRLGYRHTFNQAADYFRYLLERDPFEPLSSLERENLTHIRASTDVVYTGFNDLLPYTQDEVTGRDGQSRFNRLRTWSSIQDNRDMVFVLENMGRDLSLLPTIGENDMGFKSFRETRASSVTNYDSLGLLYSGERKYSEEEMLERAVEFMRTFAVGDVANAVFPQEPLSSGRTDHVVSGSGGGGGAGDFTRFSLQDNNTQWNYDIGVTEVGGHINQVELRENSSQVGSEAALLQMAEKLITKWAEFEGVALELLQQHDNDDQSTFVYALVVDDVVVTDWVVGVTVYFNTSTTSTIIIDADRYFFRYNATLPGRASITAIEALERLSPNVTPTDDPRLEVSHERLLYAIPVTGVDRVRKIYIDALTGEYVKMEYEYSR